MNANEARVYLYVGASLGALVTAVMNWIFWHVFIPPHFLSALALALFAVYFLLRKEPTP